MPPSGYSSAYEAAMRQYTEWIVSPETCPANLPEIHTCTCSHAKKVASDNEPIRSVGSTDEKGVDNAAKKTQSYYKGYFSAESFSNYQDVIDTLMRPVSSYSLMFEHPSVQKSFMKPAKKKKNGPKKNDIVRATPKPKQGPKKAISKGENRFPRNVRTLTGTGIFDGVRVQYVLHETQLGGIIKGAGYLCGCDSCNYSKTVNADEFERHAGCQTNHPNNHIFFANGKTIHRTVVELKSTPENMLCDAILTVTGSPINESAYRDWKVSFEASLARKLQNPTRIG